MLAAVRGAIAVDWAGYSLAIPSQSQTRPAPVELLQVRRRNVHRSARLPRGHGCQGTVLHGGLHPRNGHLQPPVFQRQQAVRAESRRAESRECRQCVYAIGNGQRPQDISGVRCGRRGVFHHWSHNVQFSHGHASARTSGGERSRCASAD